LFDPGRVKQGLAPRERFGPILQAGRSYSLVISDRWTDADGQPLEASFQKDFVVGPADETSPDPSAWVIRPPRVGTAELLTVDFPDALDHAMLARVIGVSGPDGKALEGEVVVERAETRWTFRPRAPWISGAYNLVISHDLEDPSGNAIGRPFEVDAIRPVPRSVEALFLKRSFVIPP
jgi:hypothetical protein